jgi:hypothetical protein
MWRQHNSSSEFLTPSPYLPHACHRATTPGPTRCGRAACARPAGAAAARARCAPAARATPSGWPRPHRRPAAAGRRMCGPRAPAAPQSNALSARPARESAGLFGIRAQRAGKGKGKFRQLRLTSQCTMPKQACGLKCVWQRYDMPDACPAMSMRERTGSMGAAGQLMHDVRASVQQVCKEVLVQRRRCGV